MATMGEELKQELLQMSVGRNKSTDRNRSTDRNKSTDRNRSTDRSPNRSSYGKKDKSRK